MRTPARSHARRGTVLVLVAVCLMVFVGFAALTIDLGYLYMLNGEMQRSVDSSALAGASGLHVANDEEIHARAHEFAALNPVGGHAVSEREATVVIGHWESGSRTFTPHNSEIERQPNAVRVTGRRDEVSLFLAPALGVNTSRVEKSAVALRPGPCRGIWGIEGITGRSVYTDSYNSLQGAYGAGEVYQNGDLCSCRNIVLNGSVEVHGDVMNGEGYGTRITGSSYEVWGTRGDQSCDSLEVPVFDVEEAAINNDNSQIPLTSRGRDPFNGSPYNLRLSATDNLILPPGDYYLTSAQVSGGATITVTGPTRIFISGPATFTGGGFINSTADPHNLTIYSVGPSLTVTGTSDFLGSIIAPETDIILPGDSQYFGMIIGRTVEAAGNVQIHVDESLLDSSYGAAPVLVQ